MNVYIPLLKYISLVKASNIFVFTIQETRCFSSSVAFFLPEFFQAPSLFYDQMFPFELIFILHFLKTVFFSVFSSVIN